MKKLLTIFLTIAITFSMLGCGSEKVVAVNIADSESVTGTAFGKDAMFEIGGNLWYDSTTGIVYWWNGLINDGYRSATTPSPYYAPNGLPYRYSPESNTFEEIDN